MRKILAVCLAALFALSIGVQPGQAQPRPLRITVVGDSFSAGVGATDPANGFAQQLAARGCWSLNLVARSGSGYAASSDPFVSVPRITAAAGSLPDVIVIQGSGNDRGDGRLFAAASGLYLTYRLIAPQARIVVVGPTGAPNAKHDNINEIRRYLRDAAAVTGTTFLDPLAQRWLDPNVDYDRDGIHPNGSGHARLATTLFDALSAMGVGSSCR